MKDIKANLKSKKPNEEEVKIDLLLIINTYLKI